MGATMKKGREKRTNVQHVFLHCSKASEMTTLALALLFSSIHIWLFHTFVV